MHGLARGITATLLMVFLGSPVAGAQDGTFFRIAGGAGGGSYAPIAGLIAKAISEQSPSPACEDADGCGVPGLTAVAQSSEGSVDNIEQVQTAAVESGFASAEVVNASFAGEDLWEARPFNNLRVIANLFPEYLHLVLPEGNGIGSISELQGQRVSIGQTGSATQVAVRKLLESNGVSLAALDWKEMNLTQSSERLGSGDLDAYFYVTAAGGEAMTELATSVGMELHSLSDDVIDRFLERAPVFARATIKAGTYEGIGTDVATVAVNAQWITGANQDEDLIHAITKVLWSEQSLDLLSKGHPNGRFIRPERALVAVRTPLHPGAERFYRDAGLITD